MKNTQEKLSELLINKHSKYHLKATKKDLALIALKLFMENRSLLASELEEAVEELRDYIKTHKPK